MPNDDVEKWNVLLKWPYKTNKTVISLIKYIWLNSGLHY